jgi:hypothetical protein
MENRRLSTISCKEPAIRAGIFMGTTLDFIEDELARYGIEDGFMRARLSKLLNAGYTPEEIVRGIDYKFRWNDEHGRIDVAE